MVRIIKVTRDEKHIFYSAKDLPFLYIIIRMFMTNPDKNEFNDRFYHSVGASRLMYEEHKEIYPKMGWSVDNEVFSIQARSFAYDDKGRDKWMISGYRTWTREDFDALMKHMVKADKRFTFDEVLS